MKLPNSSEAASGTSRNKKARYMRSVRFELGLLTFAALASSLCWIVGDVNLWQAAAVFAFSGAVVVNIAVGRVRLSEQWFRQRAFAESMKTASWSYAVGGDPFGIDEVEALAEFRALAVEIASDLELEVAAADHEPSQQMEELRQSSLPTRQSTYRAARVADQLSWYQTKAQANLDRARLAQWATRSFELAAIVLGVLSAIGAINGAWFGALGAFAAAMIAWSSSAQHSVLAESYSLAAREISAIQTNLDDPVKDESAWADLVQEVERAFSREHTVWAARQEAR